MSLWSGDIPTKIEYCVGWSWLSTSSEHNNEMFLTGSFEMIHPKSGPYLLEELHIRKKPFCLLPTCPHSRWQVHPSCWDRTPPPVRTHFFRVPTLADQRRAASAPDGDWMDTEPDSKKATTYRNLTNKRPSLYVSVCVFSLRVLFL